ncbi:MAG: ROK family protein [bacterium]
MIVGVDLGGTKILTALADSEGKMISSVKIDTQADLGPDKVIANMIRSIILVAKQAKIPMSRISKIGIGAPGPILGHAIIVSPPNLPGWTNVNIKSLLQKKLKKHIYIENDANAAALGELLFGAGKGFRNLVYITISTGIGGGIIINRQIYTGALGTAGEIGHMVIDPKGPKCGCGNRGCLEALASGPAIAKMSGQKNALQTELAAKKGNKKSQNAINAAAKSIGIGIANINNILNPDIFVIGGGVSNMGSLLLTPVKAWAKQYSMEASRKSLIIVPAKLKNNAGVMGAIAACMRSYE